MATDVYLQIDGIKGESTDSKHKDWIEVTNVQWGIHQPRSMTASTAGGMTVGRAELSEITFRKVADLSSPILQQTCAVGQTIPKATFEFFRADGQGERIKYYQVELKNVMISRVMPNSGDNGLIQETIALAYSEIKWGYTQQKIGGGCGGNTAGGWDCAGNKKIS